MKLWAFWVSFARTKLDWFTRSVLAYFEQGCLCLRESETSNHGLQWCILKRTYSMENRKVRGGGGWKNIVQCLILYTHIILFLWNWIRIKGIIINVCILVIYDNWYRDWIPLLTIHFFTASVYKQNAYHCYCGRTNIPVIV